MAASLAITTAGFPSPVAEAAFFVVGFDDGAAPEAGELEGGSCASF